MRQLTFSALLLTGLISQAQAAGWTPVRTVDGVAVESRPTESGFDVHRGEASVCTDLDSLEAFVADTSHFGDWVPYTRSVQLLDQSADDLVYYVRSATPWPFKDRDMVYRITWPDSADDGLRLLLTGLPEYHPETENTERIRAAAGEWHLVPVDAGIRVRYQLYVHPGAAPAFMANRRLATVVGRTLANLAAHFPCTAT